MKKHVALLSIGILLVASGGTCDELPPDCMPAPIEDFWSPPFTSWKCSDWTYGPIGYCGQGTVEYSISYNRCEGWQYSGGISYTLIED